MRSLGVTTPPVSSKIRNSSFRADDQTVDDAAHGGRGGSDLDGKLRQGDLVVAEELRELHELRFTLNVSDSQYYKMKQDFPFITRNVRLDGKNAEAVMAIHKTLREAREKFGMSQDDAARHLGISGASFSRMESGKSSVTTDRLFKLAALYRVSAASLLEGAVVTPRPLAIDLTTQVGHHRGGEGGIGLRGPAIASEGRRCSGRTLPHRDRTHHRTSVKPSHPLGTPACSNLFSGPDQ